MSTAVPRVYLFFGEDEFAIRQAVADLEARAQEQDPAGLDRVRLDAKAASLNEVLNAVAVVPFFAERRLVVLINTPAKTQSEDQRVAFIRILDQVPPSTALVLIVDNQLKDKHWLRRWVAAAKDKAFEREFSSRRAGGMVAWIREQAAQYGGEFSYPGAAELAALVGEDTRTADQEIQKLLAFVNYERPAEPEDVQQVCLGLAQGDIFAMVDALGRRDGRTTLRQLKLLLEEQEAFQVFGMVVRQFRLLLQTRELLEAGLGEGQIASRIGMHPYVAGKMVAQVSNFTLPALEQIYHTLVEVDENAKTGGLDLETALHILPAALTR